MHSMRYTKGAFWLAAIVVLIVVVAIAVILAGRHEDKTAEVLRPQGDDTRDEGALHPNVAQAEERKDVDASLLREHVDALGGEPAVGEKIAGKTLAEWEQERRGQISRMDAAMTDYRARTEQFFMAAPLYQDVEAQVKEKMIAEFGPVTVEAVPDLMERSIAFKEEFWSNGDFDHLENFDVICKSRALLEICLDADPENEKVLRELIDVLHSGWPKAVSTEYASDKLRFAHYMHKYDLAIALERLYSEHLSRRDTATVRELTYVFDLVTYCWRSPDEPGKFEPLLNHFVTAPSERIKEYGLPDVSNKVGIAAAEWAVSCAEKEGPAWERYAGIFRPMIEEMKKGERPSLAHFRTMLMGRPRCTMDPTAVRLTGRGRSFLGPAAVAEVLEPYHVWRAKHPE